LTYFFFRLDFLWLLLDGNFADSSDLEGVTTRSTVLILLITRLNGELNRSAC
jgi:hypothetical protein